MNQKSQTDIKGDFPESGYRFLKWKLEENKFLLQWGCEMHLAWLKATKAKNGAPDTEKAELKAQVLVHLANLDKLQNQSEVESIEVTWLDREHSLKRGQYTNKEDLELLSSYCHSAF